MNSNLTNDKKINDEISNSNNLPVSLLTNVPDNYKNYTKIKLKINELNSIKSYLIFLNQIKEYFMQLLIGLENKIKEIPLFYLGDIINKSNNKEKIKKFLVETRETNPNFISLNKFYDDSVKSNDDTFLVITQFCAILDQKTYPNKYKKNQLWYLDGLSYFGFELKQLVSDFIDNLTSNDILDSINDLKKSLQNINLIEIIFNSLIQNNQ